MNIYIDAPLFGNNILCPHCYVLHPYKQDICKCYDGYYRVVIAKFSKNEYLEFWKNLFFIIYQEQEDKIKPIFLSKSYPWIGNILKKHMNNLKITKIDLLQNKILYSFPFHKFKLFNNLIPTSVLKRYLKCGRVVVEQLSPDD